VNSSEAYIFVGDDAPVLAKLERMVSPRSHSFTPLISTFAGDQWRKVSEGIFTHVWPTGGSPPGDAGFIIRLSVHPAIADDVLRRTVPIIVGAGCAFKVIANTALLELACARYSSEESAGDFMAIYPISQPMFNDLAEKLQRATQGIKSSYIPMPLAETSGRTALGPDHPWPGLDYFLPNESSYFFGRGDEQVELAQRLEQGVLTVVLGQPGVGKSSLLRAGLKPLFDRMRWEPVYLRLQCGGAAHPVQQVRDEINRVLRERHIDGAPFGEGQTLREYFHAQKSGWVAADGKFVVPVLIFDQFDDVFTFDGAAPGASGPVEALWTQIANLVENRVRETINPLNSPSSDSPKERTGFKAVISLRQDHLPELLARRRQIPPITQNHFPLKLFNGRKAIEAVLGPGRRLFDPASAETLAEQIVRRVARETPPSSDRPIAAADVIEPLDNLRIEPALLSFFCRQLNEARKRSREVEAGASLITAKLVDAAAERIFEDFFQGSDRARNAPPASQPQTTEQKQRQKPEEEKLAGQESEPPQKAPLLSQAGDRAVRRSKYPAFGLDLLLIIMLAVLVGTYLEQLQRKRTEVKLQESISNLAAASNTVKSANIKLTLAESNLALKESNLLVLAQQARKHELETHDAKEQNSSLVAEQTNLQSRIIQLNREKAQAEFRLAQWSRLLSDLTNQIASLNTQKEELEARNEALAVSNEAIANLNTQKEELEARNEALAVSNQAIANLNRQKEQLEASNEALTVSNRAIANLSKQKEELEARNKALAASNEATFPSLVGDRPSSSNVSDDNPEAALESLPGNIPAATTPDIKPSSPRNVNVLLTHGQCLYSEDGTNFHTLDVHHVLRESAIIRTGKRSWSDLFIRRAGITVRLAPESEMKIAKLSESSHKGVRVTDTLLELLKGRIFTVVRALVPGSILEISDAAGRSVIAGGGLGSYMITAPGPDSADKLSVIPLRVISQKGTDVFAPGQKYSAKDGATLPLAASPWETMLIQLDELDAETDKALAEPGTPELPAKN